MRQPDFSRLLFRGAGGLLVRAARGSSRRFLEQLDRPAASQETVLKSILSDLCGTAYGHSLGVSVRDGYSGFAAKVPLATYEDLRSWIERQRNGEEAALTSERPLFYERTSGSTGPVKFIPCTPSLRRSFNRMFLLWARDLLTHGPDFETGTTFISVSPSIEFSADGSAAPSKDTQDDRDYLGWGTRALLGRFFLPPPGVAAVKDPASFRDLVCLHLLAAQDLEIFSLWSPVYLLALLNHMERRWKHLLARLESGRLECQGRPFSFRTPGAKRRNALRAMSRPRWEIVWPRLKLISCWASGQSRVPASQLGRHFPGVLLQPKGLLATEAPMTLPLIQAGGFVPLLQEVFFEFENRDGNILRLHELECGDEYSPILSQRGGLFRYRIGDRVRATHRYRETPCLEFLGRQCQTSDLAGEKLSEDFAGDVLERLPIAPDHYRILAPVQEDGLGSHYVLLTEGPADDPALEERLDALLGASYRYRQARLLGQLDPPRVVRVPDLKQRILDRAHQAGTKWAAQKPSPLLLSPMGDALLRLIRKEGTAR